MKTTIAQTITFGQGGNAVDLQRGGWSDPERTWTWTDGHRCVLEFQAPDAPFGYYLELDFGCLILWPERPSQPVVIWLGDRRIGLIDARQEGIYAVYCPPPGGRTTTLTFELPGAVRHRDVRPGGDPRTLGLSFRRIRFMPLIEERGSLPSRQSRILIAGNTKQEAVERAEGATGVPLQELLTSFEMLSGDCWFGLMQRILGYEPLGMLRFAGTTPRIAIHELATGFDRIGHDISPIPAPDGSDEWMITDKIGVTYHSGRSLSVAADQVVVDERRKMAFLRAKFLAELEEGRKIFVFAECAGQEPEAAMSIFLALRRVSNAKMLWVRPTPYGGEHGYVQEIASGLFMGFMDFRGVPMIADIPIGGWLSVLASAFNLVLRQ